MKAARQPALLSRYSPVGSALQIAEGSLNVEEKKNWIEDEA